uniref:Uncharacterized protein n=1 Tax=Piliocolobus tephrosceles TaxID=591936 RepID=A0A8C9I3G7_9PRIM
MDTQKDVQPPKQKPMTYICIYIYNEIKYRDPIRFRECVYKITYKKRFCEFGRSLLLSKYLLVQYSCVLDCSRL